MYYMLHFFGRQPFTKLQGVNKFCCTKNHDIEKLLHNYPLIASISSASMLSSISCKTSVRVFQVTGCLPLPVIHCSRISLLISSALFIYSWAIALTLCQFSSSNRKRPKSWYLMPISWGMLIFLSLPWKWIHSRRVGWSAWPSIEAWSIKVTLK